MPFLIFLAIVGLGDHQPSVLEGDVTSEHCGIACIYGILKSNGKTASLEEIESRVRSLHPHAVMSELTLAQLRTTIQSFGLHAVSYRSNRNPEQIPTPSILYLRPKQVGGDRIGHVILLQSISNGRARICDFTAGIGRRDMTIDQLRSFWDGELIVASREQPGFDSSTTRNIALGVFLILGSVLSFRWLYRRRIESTQLERSVDL